ncbi:hypothetical protein VW29_19395 [Devosia limi DSM 17137]|uniref:Uncharacterized protein n=1 Tax=Devosia limi DSM 17137 TaxID=1121477 RepID=A0A0F5L599_9HYPH|nr:hypothetical protein [Devosia limi]KKB76812.1 hypothetical protein VW29_19395 [Devosia limi DSM 17137]SHF28828.1 hypothetical protein SAMN02745223_02223 [Devosia limi DSM 17137]
MARGGADVVILLILLAVIAWVISIVLVALMYLAMGIAALAAFIAFTWTLLCLIAWRNGLRLGRIYIDAGNARAFIVRGVLGAVSVPAFLLLAEYLTDLTVKWEYLTYYIAGGYTVFSVGFEYLVARHISMPYVDEDDTISLRASRQQEVLPPPSQPRLTRYASWDDE